MCVKIKCVIFIPCFFLPFYIVLKIICIFLNYVRSNLEHMSSDKKIYELFNFLNPFSFTHIRNVAIKHFVGANINNRAKTHYMRIYTYAFYIFSSLASQYSYRIDVKSSLWEDQN